MPRNVEVKSCPFLHGFLCPPWRKVKVSSAAKERENPSSNNNNTYRYNYAEKDVYQVFAVAPPALNRKARRKDKENPQPSQEEPKLYLEEVVLERKIPDADLRQLVDLPAGLDYNEWLASHTLALFDHINLLYGTISEFCTQSGCPDMIGPSNRQYQWFDEKGKKCKVAAPQYVDYVMTFAQKTINDETIFPTKYANDFPGSFESIVKKIHRLLFHVMAHMYHVHFRELVLLNLHSHLNCLFAHFVLLNETFHLTDDKEIEVLADLVHALKLHSQEEAAEPPQPSASQDPQQRDNTVIEHDDSDKDVKDVKSNVNQEVISDPDRDIASASSTVTTAALDCSANRAA